LTYRKKLTVELNLSDRDLGILVSAELMLYGYPFTKTIKNRLSPEDQELITPIVERMIRFQNEAILTKSFGPRAVEVSRSEASALVQILENCLDECAGDLVTIQLILHAEDENEVRALVEQLQVIASP